MSCGSKRSQRTVARSQKARVWGPGPLRSAMRGTVSPSPRGRPASGACSETLDGRTGADPDPPAATRHFFVVSGGADVVVSRGADSSSFRSRRRSTSRRRTSLLSTTNSTRRFFAQLSALVLGTSGRPSP